MSLVPPSNGNSPSSIRSPVSSRDFYEIVLSPKPKDVRKRMVLLNSGPWLYTNDITEITARAKEDKGKHGPIVCIVENISKSNFRQLESEWSLKPDFFETHYLNPRYEQEALWRPRPSNDEPASSDQRASTSCERCSPKAYDHIEGNFVYHGISVHDTVVKRALDFGERHVFIKPWEEEKIICSNTRISYYRVNEYLYLFLVDAPHPLQNRYEVNDPRIKRPSLRLPYATNFEGLILPQVIEYNNPNQDPNKLGRTHYRLFESVDRVFRHRWRRQLLFILEPKGELKPFPVAPLCYMLSDSLSQTNLNYFTRTITSINAELRRKNLTIEKRLHDHWEDIGVFLVRGLGETADNIPKPVFAFWEHLEKNTIPEMRIDGPTFNPVRRHHMMLKKADQLERLFVETFQMLMSSLSVQAARMSIAQSRRATQLTWIAVLFLPLSLITGVFGMNFKELNGAVLPIWVFFAVSLPVSIAIVVGSQISLTKSFKSEEAFYSINPYEHRASGA